MPMNSVDKYRYRAPETECRETAADWIICQSKEDYVYKDLDDEI